MIRYFYYLIFLNMLANIILFVPRILISHRFEGSMMSILLSVPIGFTLLYFFVNSISKFPGQGLPEIMKGRVPSWIRIAVLLHFIMLWFLAGGITLTAFSQITMKYINPDVSSFYIILAFVILVGLIARTRSESVLYSMEILLVLNVPIITWILYKTMTNESMNYDACIEIVTHVFHRPTWDTLAAGTYIFTGYTNLVIFNRIIGTKKRFPYLWFLPIIGFGVLVTSFLIPIGYHGTIAVNDYVYPWISTADSMHVEFGLVERMLFIFLLLYTTISLAGAYIHWHVCLELCKKLIPSQSDKAYFSWMIVGLFGLIVCVFYSYSNDETLYEFTVQYLNLRFASEIVLVCLLVFLARRKKS
jgi:hypothetical protein